MLPTMQWDFFEYNSIMKSFLMQIILFSFLIENKVINRHNAGIKFDYLILNTTYIMLHLLLFFNLILFCKIANKQVFPPILYSTVI